MKLAARAARCGREWLPPAAQELLRPLVGRSVHYRGVFGDWEAASSRARGYDDVAILETIERAALQVKSGAAAAERDGVLLARAEHPWPVLASCLRAAAERANRLAVLDFGGSLGSSYFQCREFLRCIALERWSVVEQPHFARCGRAHFEDATLRFFDTIEDSVRDSAPDLVLLSSVLQYLPQPEATLAALLSCAPRWIVLDRTPVWDGPEHWTTVQHVPARIYRASYPCRVFSAELLRREFGQRYELIADFPGSDGTARASGRRFRFAGMILRQL